MRLTQNYEEVKVWSKDQESSIKEREQEEEIRPFVVIVI